MGKTHLTTGVTSSAWTAVALAAIGVPPGVCLIAMPVGAYAALLPDLDHPKSIATYSVPPLTNIVSWIIRQYTPHRGFTHTPAGAVAMALTLTLPLAFVGGVIGSYWWAFTISIAVGCLTHDWGDMRTTGGLPKRRRDGRFAGRRTIGRTFDVNSDREHALRAAVYRPAAIASVIAALIAVSTPGGPLGLVDAIRTAVERSS